jgi:ribonuclease VapC
VDTSAVIAILRDEPGAERVAHALFDASSAKISAATLVELYAVADSRTDPALSRRLDRLLAAARIETVPFTADQASLARAAYRDFGRGSGHRAHLNLGDCFAYALAAATGEPLLFVGNDFTATDLTPAIPEQNA